MLQMMTQIHYSCILPKQRDVTLHETKETYRTKDTDVFQ